MLTAVDAVLFVPWVFFNQSCRLQRPSKVVGLEMVRGGEKG